MNCGKCNRKIKGASGFVSGVPVGPVCLRNLIGATSRATPPSAAHRRAPPRIDQPELFEGEYFMLDEAEKARLAIELAQAKA